jgi:hypothetical protein
MANPYDKVLSKKGLKYEDLTKEEKELYISAGKGTRGVTLSDLKEHLDDMLYDLTLEHCDTPDTPEFQDKNNKQKARIKNYALLKAYMEVPDKVAKALEREAEVE